MKLMPWMVLLTLTLVTACSGSKSAQKVSEETPQIELSDADEFVENPSDEQPADAAVAEPTEETVTETSAEPTTETPAEVATESTTEDVVVANNEPLVQESTLENTAPVVSHEAGAQKQYTVQKNETLMMIAFKLYGDYSRWKDLASQNREALKDDRVVRAGMVLNYEAPAEEFVWNPQGNPYLIKTGDTLGLISKEVYADVKKWKLLWENNRPLIKDPNKIYAGFTIYYLENGREVANQL